MCIHLINKYKALMSVELIIRDNPTFPAFIVNKINARKYFTWHTGANTKLCLYISLCRKTGGV